MSYFNVDRGNVWKFSVLRGNAWGFSVSRGNTWKFVVGVITDRTAPVLQTAIIPSDGLTLNLTYDETLDTNSVPVVSDFDIGLLAGVVVDAVAISGTVVILTMSRTILEGETLTVGYTAGSNPIQDDYANQAANLSNEPVTNNSTVDGDAPIFQTGIIPADGLTLAMTYDEALDETSVPAFGDFSLSGTSSVVASVGVSGLVVTLTMDTAILAGETVLLDYTAGANPIRDESENNAANLTNQATTNNSEVSTYSAEYQAVYDAFENTPSDADADAQNTFVETLVDGDVWSELDRLPIYASHASGRDSLLDWLDPTNNSKVATIVNAPIWTQYQGYKGNGTNAYINSNFSASTDGVNVAINNESIGAYSRGNTTGFFKALFGSGDDTRYYTDFVGTTQGGVQCNGQQGAALVNDEGFHSMGRPDASNLELYYNGSTNGNFIVAGKGLKIPDVQVLSQNTSHFFTEQVSMFYDGAYLNSDKQLILYNAFQALMTYYGTEV